jgi:pimeloyl-ACP methyl ester carboxylesterase
MRRGTALTPIASLLTIAGLIWAAHAEQRVDIGGAKLDMRRSGSGTPAVVIATGFGEHYATWDAVADSVAGETSVIQYDRAGYGRSDAGPLPRTVARSVTELAALLEASGVTPPYLLIGHSLGALHVLLFASRYPDLTAGVIVIDPPPETFLSGERFEELREMAQEETSRLEAAAAAARSEGNQEEAVVFEILASEHENMFSEGAIEARTGKGLGSIPVMAVASGQPNPAFGDSAQAFQSYWAESTRELSARLENGRFILAAKSSHHVHHDDPGLIIRAIREMVIDIRSNHSHN